MPASEIIFLGSPNSENTIMTDVTSLSSMTMSAFSQQDICCSNLQCTEAF